MKVLYTILTIIFFICIHSCNEFESKKDIEYQLSSTFQSTDNIRYNVEGGGNIDFIIENNPDSLSITISRYQHQNRNDSLKISKPDVDSLDLVIIDAMFKGTIDIGGVIYKNDLLVGSWTYLYIDNNQNWLRVANEDIIGELSSFNRLVNQKIN